MKSFEGALLTSTNICLSEFAATLGIAQGDHEGRLAMLEVLAGEHAGWDVAEYWREFGFTPPAGLTSRAGFAKPILASLSATGIPIPLALAALAREEIATGDQRKTGAYYTDFRLAQMLASESVPRVTRDGIWVDTACGTGTLLVAAVMQADSKDRDTVIRTRLAGADLASNALRGALLAVASLTTDLSAVAGFSKRLLKQDSLRSRTAWRALAPRGAALIIGNPPWERLRASRHETAINSGSQRHYGQGFEVDVDLTKERDELIRYLRNVTSETSLQGSGEHDFYKLFLELGLSLAAEEGILAFLLPAGVVRSQGTTLLRREIIEASTEVSISVMENRARHFAIDTRFKFLALTARVGKGRKHAIGLRVADRSGALPSSAVTIQRAALSKIRPDLSLPEVRSEDEWELYARLHRAGRLIGDERGPWRPAYKREVDMTNDRKFFRRSRTSDSIPLVEGRHVTQFRSRAKRYVSGEGRAALWSAQDLSDDGLHPQFYVPLATLRPATRTRVDRSRIGFCDISGQTNERTLLAARIPPDVVCGNKVPTLTFSAGGPGREDLFLALSNSLVVDWMLRRVVTTTVNFFILDALPLPVVTEKDVIGRELINLSRRVTAAEGDPALTRRDVGRMRARMDALVAFAWGVSVKDMQLVLDDFPLLDRGQPALEGETTSTITADHVLLELGRLYDEDPQRALGRVGAALALGALPYVPAEYA